MALMRWDPFTDFGLVPNDVNWLFERMFDGGSAGTTRRAWTPAMDVYEEDGAYVVRTDLPGVDQDDVQIEIQDNVLRIAGERQDEHREQRAGYVRSERSYGSFQRSLSLPEGIDPDSIDASFDRGELSLRIPKPRETQPRRVEIGGKRSIEGAAREQR